MTGLANWVMLAHGWRRVLVLLLAGAVAGLSVPPLFILPALFAGLPVLVWSLDGAETGPGLRRRLSVPFAVGFWFGLGYFLVAIHWIGAAFFVEGGWVLALAPLGVLALAAILALFWGAGTALAHLWWRPGPGRILALATALTLAEWARGHFFTGFPFDLLGYALTANDQMMQAAALVGVDGLTFVAALIALTPALIWPAADRDLGPRLAPFFLALGVLAAQLGYGQYRLDTTKLEKEAGLTVRLVQPDIAQADKWRPGNEMGVLQKLLDLSSARKGPNDPGLTGVAAVIWPESAFPFYLSDYPEALARIARMLPQSRLLITGAPYLDPSDPTRKTAYNAVLAINHDGEIVASYAKSHLVPFGEYLPFKAFFARFGIRQFVPGNQGWTPGGPRRLMRVPGLPPLLPLICYEAVFPTELGPVAKAGIILNLTNDAWFDGSIGPAQHFDHARLRAVEQGKPLLRVANTGITAGIDPLGRTTAQLAPETEGVLDVTPDKPLPKTLYAQLGDWPLLGLLAVLALWFSASASRARRHPRKAPTAEGQT